MKLCVLEKIIPLCLCLLCLFPGCSDDTTVIVAPSPSAGSISGMVYAPGGQTGTVFVTAIRTNSANLQHDIRVMETAPKACLSDKVSGYNRLSSPGTYCISNLPEGEYVLFAWIDVNKDGSVDHLDYAEPTGWHQNRTHLPPILLTVAAGCSIAGIDIGMIAPTPYSSQDLTIAVGQGGGSLKTVKSQKVLHLWGTDPEKAYCRGYLLAPQILDWINYVLVEHYAKSVDNYENNYLPVIVNRTEGMDPYQGEIDALLQGMRDRLPDLRLPWLERDITADDIRGLNNLYMSALLPMKNRWPLEKNPAPLAVDALFFCTNASFWGPWTDNAEVSGGLIVGKNMDGENDLRKVTVNTLLVVAVEPEPGSGRKKFVGIDWPGFIGTQNGMNEDGLILTPQAAATMPNWDASDFLDYSLLYRETLERCTTISDAEKYWLNRVHTKISGFNTAVSTPYIAGQLSCPSVTLETDSFGGAIREPLDFTPSDPDAILTTNTFFKYSGVYPEAVAITGSYQSELHRTNYRYLAMLELMDLYRKRSKTVGTPEIIEILQAASITAQYQDITEWSFIGYPNKKMFALAKEDLHNKLLNASYAEFFTFTFDEVFQ